MVLENVVIMGCCDEKLCSRSEYLGGGGREGEGREAQKRGTTKEETTTGGTGLLTEGRVCLNHAIRYLFKKFERVLHQLNSKTELVQFFFFFHYIKPTKRFLGVCC